MSSILISNLDTAFQVTERGGAIAIDSDVTFTGGGNYTQGYLRFTLDSAQTGDQFKLSGAADPNAAGAISVDGGDVFLGNGAGRERIGSIDAVENGENGQPLKILFSMPLPNSGFEDGETGWQISRERYGNDKNEINFHNADVNLTYSGAGSTGTVKIGTVSNSSFSGDVVSGAGVNGSNALYLSSSGTISGYGDGRPSTHEPDGNGSLHGPYATSAHAITVMDGDSLILEFNAIAQTDDYEVFGLLRKVDANGDFLDNSLTSTNNLVLFAERGATTNGYKTVTVDNLPGGEYKFEFVGGSYDGTGGFALGSHLYVDNIRLVPGQGITDEIVSQIARQVTYESTADDAPTQRTVTVEASTVDGPPATGAIELEIAHVNNPPVLADSILATVDEDTLAPDGATVQALFGDKFSDPDATHEAGDVAGDSMAGIAIVDDASTPEQGAWQFSVDGGTSWANVTDADVSSGQALLLDNDALLRFLPAPNWNGTPGALSVHAVDDSYPGAFSSPATAPQITVEYLDVAATTAQPDSPVSLDSAQLATEIRSVNDAPVIITAPITHAVNGGLTDTISGTIEASDEHDGAPDEGGTPLVYGVEGGTVVGNLNTLIGKYGTLTVDTATGTYTYTPDPSKVGPLTVGYADEDAFTLFVTDGITPATLPLTLEVTGVNDPPAGADGDVTIDEDANHALAVADFGFHDPVDGVSDALLAVKITSLPIEGALTLDGAAVSAGDFVSATDIAAGKLVYTPVANANGASYASFTFQVQDDGGTEFGGIDLDPTPRTLTIHVTPVNDAPVLVSPGTLPIMPSISEDTALADLPVGLVSGLIRPADSTVPDDGRQAVVVDVDVDTRGAGEGWDGGIAIYGLNSADPVVDGVWQYNLGAGWQNMGDVSMEQALLLDSTASLRFVPGGDNGGQPSISYYLWDGSAGNAGDKVDVGDRGGVTPFSSAGATSSLNVTHVNDAPVLDLNGDAPGLDHTITFLPRGAAVAVVANDIAITDVDQINGLSDHLVGATVKLTAGAVDNLFGDHFEQLSARDGNGEIITEYAGSFGGILVESNADGTELTLTGKGSWNDYQDVLRTIQYQNTNPNAANGPRTIEISVTDGAISASDAPATTTATTTVNVRWSTVADLNGSDSGRDYATHFIEDAGSIAVATSTASLDNQAVNVTQVVLSLTNPLDGGDERLFVSADNLARLADLGISVDVIGNGGHELILSATSSAGIAAQAMQVALRMVHYDNASQNPDTTQRMVEVTVSDINGEGIGAVTTIGVTSVNDAPVFTGSLAGLVTEGGTASLQGVLTSTDPDNSPEAIRYIVTAQPDNGVVFRELPDGTREVIDVVITEPLTAEQIAALQDGKGYFTQAEVDAGLIHYKHDGSDGNLDGFGFKVVDDLADYPLSEVLEHVLVYDVTPVDDAVRIVGQLQAGATLTADISDIDNLGDPASVRYLWTVEGEPAVEGETYLLRDQDAGKTISLRVLYDNADGDPAQAESGASSPIAGDHSGPSFIDASVDGSALTLAYDADTALDLHTSGLDQFVVTVDGREALVTAVSVDGDARTVTLTLAPPVAAGQKVTVSYLDPTPGDDADAIQDEHGNDAASLLNFDVTNQTGVVGPEPEPEPGPVQGSIVGGTTTTSTGADGTITQTTTGTLGNQPVTQTIVTTPDGRIEHQLELHATDSTDVALPLLYEDSQGNEYNTWVRLPAGIGLISHGVRTPSIEDSAADLIRLIRETVADADSLLPAMLDGGQSFLDGRADDATLWVNKLTFSQPAETPELAAPIVIDGAAYANAGANPGGKLEALVIDGSGLREGSVLELQNVDFAVVVGNGLIVQGGAGANIIYGDGGAQTILAGDDDDIVHAGAGNDIVDGGAGDDLLFGNDGDDVLIAGAGNDLVHGGLNQDEAHFHASQDAYEIIRDHGLTIVRSLEDPDDVTTLVNVEILRFADGEYTVENDSYLVQIASLYQQVLGRQAEVEGFQYWAESHVTGQSMGQIALSFLYSAEYEGMQDNTFDALTPEEQIGSFYLHFLGREAEEQGHQYWVDQLENGVALDQIAQLFVESQEMQDNFYLQPTDWDFFL